MWVSFMSGHLLAFFSASYFALVCIAPIPVIPFAIDKKHDPSKQYFSIDLKCWEMAFWIPCHLSSSQKDCGVGCLGVTSAFQIGLLGFFFHTTLLFSQKSNIIASIICTWSIPQVLHLALSFPCFFLSLNLWHFQLFFQACILILKFLNTMVFRFWYCLRTRFLDGIAHSHSLAKFPICFNLS